MLLLETVLAAPGGVCAHTGLQHNSHQKVVCLACLEAAAPVPLHTWWDLSRTRTVFSGIVEVSRGSLRMIIHFLKTTCAAHMPGMLPCAQTWLLLPCSLRPATLPSDVGAPQPRPRSSSLSVSSREVGATPVRAAASSGSAGAQVVACFGL